LDKPEYRFALRVAGGVELRVIRNHIGHRVRHGIDREERLRTIDVKADVFTDRAAAKLFLEHRKRRQSGVRHFAFLEMEFGAT
jgi:hypothetical protein